MPPAPIQIDPPSLPPHPRLFANAARFDSLKAQRDPVTQQIVTLLRANAEGYLTAAPIVHPAAGSLFAMREAQGRIVMLSMMFKLTGEKRYFERARQEVFELVALPNWGTGHFLDVGESCLAAGIALDWLYDEFSPDERDRITRAIVERALLPSFEVKDEPSSWLKGDFNWNQVCHAGLSVGALAIAEREPELARRIVARAVESIPAAGASYAPDGSYPEGPSYWTYGTTFHVIMVEAMRSALGTSCGLEALPGFLKSAEFKLLMVAPSGEAYNYADYHNEHNNESLMLWFARELGRRDLATAELDAVSRRVAALTAVRPPEPPLLVSRFLALELLWWNPALPDAPEPRLPLHWTAGGHLPLAVLRSGWNDPRATYLAIKGGSPNGSHAHMDVGSFVLEADGVRWAVDLGTENYDRMRAAKVDLWNYTQNSSRWTVFRNGPEGHSIPRFDGARQDVTGHAKIRALPDDAGIVGDEVELSPLYREQVKSVRRRVRLHPDRSISIEDEWQTGPREAVYAFQWLTTAAVTPLPQGARLEQAGETLELRVEATGEFQMETADVSQAKAPQDSPNPGLSRIVIRLRTPADSVGRLIIKAVPGRRSD